jgi:hypothetical protein
MARQARPETAAIKQLGPDQLNCFASIKPVPCGCTRPGNPASVNRIGRRNYPCHVACCSNCCILARLGPLMKQSTERLR